MPPAQDSRDRVRPDPGSAGTHRGLPIRVRQANIAPQLRADSQPDSTAAPRPADANAARSPEQTRSMMNSLQQGWQRGRTDDLDGLSGDLDDEAGDGRGSRPDRNNGGAV
jgi:hypothetical protein